MLHARVHKANAHASMKNGLEYCEVELYVVDIIVYKDIWTKYDVKHDIITSLASQIEFDACWRRLPNPS